VLSEQYWASRPIGFASSPKVKGAGRPVCSAGRAQMAKLERAAGDSRATYSIQSSHAVEPQRRKSHRIGRGRGHARGEHIGNEG
jgi:hypothetical protein